MSQNSCVFCGHDVTREDGRVRHSVKKVYTYISKEDRLNGSYKHSIMESTLECGVVNKDSSQCECIKATDLFNLLESDCQEIRKLYISHGEHEAKLYAKERAQWHNLSVNELFNKALPGVI